MASSALLATLVWSAARAHAEPAGMAVVVSADVPLTSVSFTELRRLFMLERRFWKPGQQATVLYPPMDSPARAWLLRDLCGMDEAGLRRMILERMYRGEIDLAPKSARSDEETLAFVASGRGLVAIVPAALAERAPVKVLRIEGRNPRGKPLAP